MYCAGASASDRGESTQTRDNRTQRFAFLASDRGESTQTRYNRAQRFAFPGDTQAWVVVNAVANSVANQVPAS